MRTDSFSQTSEARTSTPLKESIKEADVKKLEEKPELPVVGEEKEEFDDGPTEVHKDPEKENVEPERLKPALSVASGEIPLAASPSRLKDQLLENLNPILQNDAMLLRQVEEPISIDIARQSAAYENLGSTQRNRLSSAESNSPSLIAGNSVLPSSPHQQEAVRKLDFRYSNTENQINHENVAKYVQEPLEGLRIVDSPLEPSASPSQPPATRVLSLDRDKKPAQAKRISLEETFPSNYGQQDYVQPRYDQRQTGQPPFNHSPYEQTRLARPQINIPQPQPHLFNQPQFDKPGNYLLGFEQPRSSQPVSSQPPYQQQNLFPCTQTSPLSIDAIDHSPLSGPGVHLNHLSPLPQDPNLSLGADYRQSSSLTGKEPVAMYDPLADYTRQYSGSRPNTDRLGPESMTSVAHNSSPLLRETSPAFQREAMPKFQREVSPAYSQANLYVSQMGYPNQMQTVNSQRSPHRSPTWPQSAFHDTIHEDEYQPKVAWAQPYPPSSQAGYQRTHLNASNSNTINSGDTIFSPLKLNNHSQSNSLSCSPMTSPYPPSQKLEHSTGGLRPPTEIHRALSNPSPPSQDMRPHHLKKHFSGKSFRYFQYYK